MPLDPLFGFFQERILFCVNVIGGGINLVIAIEKEEHNIALKIGSNKHNEEDTAKVSRIHTVALKAFENSEGIIFNLISEVKELFHT